MKNTTTFLLVTILIIFITILGLPLNLLPPDAALYAAISKEMYINNDFVNLYSLGNDWLDKPHLPFWLTALSFKVFGVSNFSYKLPGVLIFFYGVWATYQFVKENYNKKTAVLATIILFSSLHSVISNFDVRAEPYLTGFIMASLYWFFKYVQSKQIKFLIIGALFSAFAIMTKGIFTLIPVIAGLGGHFIVKKEWKNILNPVWFLVLVLIFVFIVPELLVLYQQFDLHPEKIVFGKNNVSGIKFFLWDSQFGRFFNTGPIRGKGDIFFFVHTLLWAFLPWAILFYIALFLKIKRNIKVVRKEEEFYSLFAFLSGFIMFSLSKFQLAHYTNIIFPFMAIITADFILRLEGEYYKLIKTYKIAQWFVIILSLLIIPILSFVMISEFNFLFLFIIIICTLIVWRVIKSKFSAILKLFYYSVITFSLFYGFMFTHFYPTLFKYQGGVNSAKYANENFKNEDIHLIESTSDFGFEFYIDLPVKRIPKNQLSNYSNKLFHVNKNIISFLDSEKINYDIIKSFDFYRITKLKGNFVNKKTRNNYLNKLYLIRIKK